MRLAPTTTHPASATVTVSAEIASGNRANPLLPTVTPTPQIQPTRAEGPLPALVIPPPSLSPVRKVVVVESSHASGEQPARPAATTLRYVFPVQPPSVTRYQYGHHDYPATDIGAPVGSHFVAVTDGYIDELSREDHYEPSVNDPATRGGLFVSLIGDDGVRYYGSHLNEVVAGLQPGDRVVAGQLLGYVGTTGNARGLAPHLHFGISYPTFAGDWEVRRGVLMPYDYLRAWEKNKNVTPDLSQIQRPPVETPPSATAQPPE
jgi:murein DD-endopeptidase MepM/ murein hydrolase activator NlpD